MKLRLKIFTFITVLFFAPSLLLAQTSPAKVVEATIDKVILVVNEKKGTSTPKEIDTKLREIIAPVFDFREMSRRCLGRNWNNITPDQQEKFQTMFSELLAQNYLKQIRENAHTSTFKLNDEKIRKNKAVVLTTITSTNGDLKIDYRLVTRNSPWKVYDVIIENIGLVSNYRSEFSDIISRDGMDSLLETLKNKLTK